MNGLIVSASPFRAVIRRMDYSASKIEDNKSEEDEDEEGSPNEKIDDEFERDEADKSNLFGSYAKRDFAVNENISAVTPIARVGDIIDESPGLGYGLMSDGTQRQDDNQNIYAGLNHS